MKHIFFDLDGTLHKEDIEFAFIRYLLKKRPLNVLIFLPIYPLVLIVYKFFPTEKWSLNLLNFMISVGCSKVKMEHYFTDFKQQFTLTPLPQVQQALQQHLTAQDQIWIISGSPVELISHFYADLLQLPNVHLIGSSLEHRYGAILLKERCLAENKVKMLDKRIQPPIQFEIGYSDSLTDLPMFKRCKQAMWVTEGKIQHLKL
ncbi:MULTISPECIES: haloacid dehalogenase-like hydrolase [Glaesserella]|uniref:Phosphatidylglycerophosphatase C n=1 Tax=Glaesserella australis TaxID=2094024 RepID=A0A328BYI6_9PAST|nr:MULTISPECIES: haloacid dehalogenase-like hydrolase [Glaesserella]AUI66532.1 phosphatidylglycerophosphatase C [Glaesserella sp. 15-184]RAL18705.1 phosphatidylglycerophosphatase C [Glaesserella australis]